MTNFFDGVATRKFNRCYVPRALLHLYTNAITYACSARIIHLSNALVKQNGIDK